LPDIAWSRRTALDPKHRPQSLGKPSSTVRREWARYPQEAHLLDETKNRIRRLLPEEIQRIQGFKPEWFSVPGVSDADSIRAAGDAVPPALATAVYRGIIKVLNPKPQTAVELCAGSGGLASGLASIPGWSHLALVEQWAQACRVLRYKKPWSPEIVINNDVRRLDLSVYLGAGILSGGLPCQPWSMGGNRLGSTDPRDLLGQAPDFVSKIAPAAFVFENVPGLLTEPIGEYLDELVAKLRRPSKKLRYGVLIGLLNAADFGVPQARKRLFIIRSRNHSSKDLLSVFDAIDSQAEHKLSWKPIDDVLSPKGKSFKWMNWPFGEPG
jgi:site-specific DNA-cytosine methylase